MAQNRQTYPIWMILMKQFPATIFTQSRSGLNNRGKCLGGVVIYTVIMLTEQFGWGWGTAWLLVIALLVYLGGNVDEPIDLFIF